MASVNVGEKEFIAVATAARSAFDEGSKPLAFTLDDLARKINAALSKNSGRRAVGNFPSRYGSLPKFKVESPLEAAGLRKKD